MFIKCTTRQEQNRTRSAGVLRVLFRPCLVRLNIIGQTWHLGTAQFVLAKSQNLSYPAKVVAFVKVYLAQKRFLVGR